MANGYRKGKDGNVYNSRGEIVRGPSRADQRRQSQAQRVSTTPSAGMTF
jgi:hypothetical protein